MNLADIIKPITLVRGGQRDTQYTGRGCFMNICAYLNGEPVTDHSPSVCRLVRAVAIFANDQSSDQNRQRLIPFIQRAIGSATVNGPEMYRRATLLLDIIGCTDIDRSRVRESMRAGNWESVVNVVVRNLTTSMMGHATTPYFNAILRFLDAALPRDQALEPVVMERAERLVYTNRNPSHGLQPHHTAIAPSLFKIECDYSAAVIYKSGTWNEKTALQA